VNVIVHGDAHSPKVGKIAASIKLRREGRWVSKRSLFISATWRFQLVYFHQLCITEYSTLYILVANPRSWLIFYTCDWLPLLAFHRIPGIIPESLSKSLHPCVLGLGGRI
jgi:hypothetical protein